MSRRYITFLQDEYYHVYNRGCNKENIVREEENYRYLLSLLTTHTHQYNISVIAYCVMPNHYHFLLRQNGEGTISACMQSIFNSYTKAFNKKYGRSGTLFEDRFKARHVGKVEYLLHLCRYIHRNPLDAGLVNNPARWEFSNYREWIGERQNGLVDTSFVESHFALPAEYKEFVLTYEPPPKISKHSYAMMFDM